MMGRPGKDKSGNGSKRAIALGMSFVTILVCEAFLLTDVIADVFYINISTSWIDHSAIEAVAVVALGAALVALGLELRRLTIDQRSFRASLKAASGELLAVIETQFKEWGLTPSEWEVALLLIKGLSVQEIADIRQSQPGTVKSQSNAIYRKAGVAGRSELVAYFVEDLLAGEDLTGS